MITRMSRLSPETISRVNTFTPWGNNGSSFWSDTSISSLCVTCARSAVPRLGSGRRQHIQATTRPGMMETKKATRQPWPWKSGPSAPPMTRPTPRPT